MTIRDMISRLQTAGKAIGYDSDVVYILNDQPADILGVTGYRNAPTADSAWAWSQPCAVVTLQTE